MQPDAKHAAAHMMVCLSTLVVDVYYYICQRLKLSTLHNPATVMLVAAAPGCGCSR